jgi:hypothetical protein
LVFSLPRSRSAWLSAFLGAPGRVVGHDIGVTCDTPADFAWRLNLELAGTCETGAAFAWRLIRRMMPEAKFAVILRPVDEVCASLARFGLTGVESEMQLRYELLRQISRQPGTMTLEWGALRFQGSCERLYRFCTGEHMDAAWWEAMHRLNIQVDMVQQLKLLQARASQIQGLKAIVAKELQDA